MQQNASAQNRMLSKEIEEERMREERVVFSEEETAPTEENVDNYTFFHEKNEKVYRFPTYMIVRRK